MKSESFGAVEDELIGAIYEAALDPSQWQPLLEKFKNIAQMRTANLIFYDRLNRQRNNIITGGYYPPGALDEYIRDFIDIDMRYAKILCQDTTDGVMNCPRRSPRAIEADETLEPALKEYFQNRVDEGYHAGMTLMRSNYTQATFSFVNAPGGEPLSDAMITLGNRLGPHLCRAMRIHHQLHITRLDNEKLRATLEKTATGLLLLDADGRVMFANQEGARILEQHRALQVGYGGRLQAAIHQDNQMLQQLIQDTNAARERIISLGESRISIPLYHEKLSHPLKITVLPLEDCGLNLMLTPEQITSVVFIADPERTWAISPEYLQQAYGLTLSECEVSQAIANGSQVLEIAAQRGTSKETVRWQIKEILQKTNTHSQVELVRLLITLSADFVTPIA